jgi:hypothetical protein
VRQLAAAAGDGSLGFAASPGQLETSLNSGYTVGPCNSYLEGPTLILFEPAARASRLWVCLVRSHSSPLGLVLASLAPFVEVGRGRKNVSTRSSSPPQSRDFRRSQPRDAPSPTGGALFADVRSPHDRSVFDRRR